MKISCPHCNASLEVDKELIGQQLNCPACSIVFAVPVPIAALAQTQKEPQTTQKNKFSKSNSLSTNTTAYASIKKSKAGCGGCCVQILAFVSIVVGLISIFTIIMPLIFIPLGVILWGVGVKMSRKYECSACGTFVNNKKVSICPGCKAKFR